MFGIISKLLSKVTFSHKKKKKKPSIIKEAIDNPEYFKLEAFIEGEEIIIKIKKKEVEKEEKQEGES